MTTGLIIGRYQPPHVSHLEVFEFAKKQGIEKLLVVKGSADKSRKPRHPFTSQECTDMLEMYLNRTGLEYQIFQIDDLTEVKKDDEELTESDIIRYSRYAKMLEDTLPKFDVVIAGNPVITLPFERLGYKIMKPKGEINCSSTYIRKQYCLHGDRCEDLLLPEQVAYMDKNGLYRIMNDICKGEFNEKK
jgi:cytidyltransferase-like protein